MKIKIKTKEGADREVKPENITVNGVELVSFYKDYLITKKNMEDFMRVYKKENMEILELWNKTK